jgi:hypothetical protein
LDSRNAYDNLGVEQTEWQGIEMTYDDILKYASLLISIVSLAGFATSWLSMKSVIENTKKQPLKTDTEISKNAIETAKGANEIAIAVQNQMMDMITDKNNMQKEIDDLKLSNKDLLESNNNLTEKVKIRDLEIVRLSKRVSELEDIIHLRKTPRA